ncbi:MAG TPA: SEC-C metal-binding domain-containing protein [Candidatus Wallbacteria bacterium]|nr:SEC-C metal-binding domain-containing protein [Candidatus Wallbacteria bacterium]
MSEKTGRNEACPCGSGLKYKKCCINKPVTSEVEKDESFETDRSNFHEKYEIIKRKNPEEIFELLNGLGFPIDKKNFMADASRFH